uniref:Uncharacterized protein n=1 Tax=Romanomermis culicivorax TaxID=13658 RepID=A0A915IK36_ROMCU
MPLPYFTPCLTTGIIASLTVDAECIWSPMLELPKSWKILLAGTLFLLCNFQVTLPSHTKIKIPIEAIQWVYTSKPVRSLDFEDLTIESIDPTGLLER